MKITVKIGQYSYTTDSESISWIKELYEMPSKYAPVVYGPINQNQLPNIESRQWDYVSVLPNGFGAAAGREGNSIQKAILFVTLDSGTKWSKKEIVIKPTLLGKTIEIEGFDSMAVTLDNNICLGWAEKTWPEGKTHIINSTDQGNTWHHRTGKEGLVFLKAVDTNRIMRFDMGSISVSSDGGKTWKREKISIQWPEDYKGDKVPLLRKAQFVNHSTGYALVVHWRHNSVLNYVPDIGVLKTENAGRLWKHIAVLEGPNIGDVNGRHTLSLEIQT